MISTTWSLTILFFKVMFKRLFMIVCNWMVIPPGILHYFVSIFFLSVSNLTKPQQKNLLKKKKSPSRGFPGGAVVKNLPANTGDTGSSPGPGRSHPHATEQPSPCTILLSLCSRAHKPQLVSPHATTTEAHVPRARALQREVTAVRSLCSATKSSPHLPQLEKACAQQWRPNAA